MNVNSATIIGHVVAKPEQKTLGDKLKVSTFDIATNYTVKGRPQVEFHHVAAFGKLAEITQKFLDKGRLVYVRGRIKTGTWEAKNQVKKSRTEIIANEMLMLDKKKQALVSAASPDEDASEAYQPLQETSA